MKRLVEPEILDELPAHDAHARRSREDLRRLNRLMAHAGIVARALRGLRFRPGRIVELGAGDGRFALDLARWLAPEWPRVEISLVDRLSIVTEETVRAFDDLTWTARPIQADALDWLSSNQAVGGCVVANLFLHHFTNERLHELLTLAAEAAVGFVACEPRRANAVLAVSRLLGLIGCNAVTRHDAVASVRAGFHGQELSALWPRGDNWSKVEGSVGLFSHGFTAERTPLRR